MIDSIYIGITGVRSHETRLNVISNNVANINTTAFKSGRVRFSDVLSNTLQEGRGAGPSRSPTNPLQSGLGVQVSTIDTVQDQGTLQSTGVDTDLAIEGDGYFILQGRKEQLYTRDGSFDFDATGKLFDEGTGMVVQGNLANADGSFRSEVEDITIPLDRESEAKATTQISLSGNLDAKGNGTGERVWSSTTEFGRPARLVSGPNPVFPLDLSVLTSGGLKVSVDEAGTLHESTLSIPTKTYNDRVELISELNSLINSNGTLKNRVLFKSNDLGEVILRTVNGGQDISVSVDNSDPNSNVVATLGFVANSAQQGQQAVETTLINNLANVGEDLSDGDVLRCYGVKSNGERFDGTFSHIVGVHDTVGDLFDVVEAVYGGVSAGLDEDTGELILTETGSGARVVGFDINFELLDHGDGSGLFGDEPPFEFSTNTQIFDEKGNTHSLTVAFTKSVIENEWNWVATVDGITPGTGNNGKAVFNEDGTLRSFEAADKNNISFVPSSGTPPLSIEIVASDEDRLGGLTQFVSSSSVSVREQNGRPAGSLVSTSIESNGSIVGLFSNGNSETLARVSLASFRNAGGLKRQAGNLFSQTESSGQPMVGIAESTVQASVRSGTIEQSNVNLAQEFTNMIVTQRGFQASARSITTADELLSELVNLKR